VDDVDDSAELQVTLKAMRDIGLNNRSIEAVLRIVAAVLWLGNVDFVPARIDGADGCAIRDKAPLQTVCRLLSLEVGALEYALTYKTLETMGSGKKMEKMQVPQNPTQAMASRDAIARSLYEQIFDLIVGRINSSLDTLRQAAGAAPDEVYTIGVLDIFGFEIFQTVCGAHRWVSWSCRMGPD
jgi:myosin I